MTDRRKKKILEIIVMTGHKFMPRYSNIQSYFFLVGIPLKFGTFVQLSMLSTCPVRSIVFNSVITKILYVQYSVRKIPLNYSKLHSVTDFRSLLKKQNMLLEMIHIIKSCSLAHPV